MKILNAKLGAFCTIINGGNWTEDRYAEEGVPVVRVSDMKGASIDLSNQKFLSRAFHEKYRKHELKKNDLVIATVGSHKTQQSSAAGRATTIPAFAEGMLLNQNAVSIRTDSKELEQRYLCLIGQTRVFNDYITDAGRGAANQIRIPIAAIKSFQLNLPPVPIQTRIADILSAYDDLIENNKRRMQLLEEAARQLYREWFVRLRFPGHEHTKITNGLPEGWERKPIPEFAQIVGGGTPKTTIPEYWDDGEVVWVTPTDVTRNSHFCLLDSEKKITEAGLKNSSAKLVSPHSILMTSRASVGFFALVRTEVCTNQGFISIVPNEKLATHFLLLQLSERVEEIRNMGTGSTYPEVSRGKFKEFEVVMPSAKTIAIFSDYASPMFDQLWALKQQNQKLRAARDLLLPKLMNGEIAV